MTGWLEGLTAIITGASAGIGRSAALIFAREGANAVLAARRAKEGEEAAEMVRSAGGSALFVRTDVSDSADVRKLVETCMDRFGALHCAFNNAGIADSPHVPTDGLEEADWDRVIGVNLKGTWLCKKHEIPRMIESGGGSIVNNASIFGSVGASYGAPYVASNHGVLGLTKTAALEYARQGVRINAICPGYIPTPLVDRLASANPDHIPDAIRAEPIGRLGTPEEAAEATAWLCSDRSSFVTGHALAVDGGFLAR